jgi:hypothetical protein
VPANRTGYTELSVGQLKIMQKVITLAVFVPFRIYVMQQPLKLNLPADRVVPARRGVLYLPRLRLTAVERSTRKSPPAIGRAQRIKDAA